MRGDGAQSIERGSEDEEGSLHWRPSMVDIAGFNETRISNDTVAALVLCIRISFTIIAAHASRTTKWPLGQFGMSRASFGWLMEGYDGISHSEHEYGNVLGACGWIGWWGP